MNKGFKIKKFICLIKNSKNKFITALCVKESKEKLLFLQIRSVSKKERKRKKLKFEEKNTEDKTVYIGQPKGLKTPSIVRVSKQFKVNKQDIVKKIIEVSDKVLINCIELIKEERIERKEEHIRRKLLHKELQLLKQEILLAKMNNTKYSHYELRRDEIAEELGYKTVQKKENSKAYLHYRETPFNGYLKIYNGGRCR